MDPERRDLLTHGSLAVVSLALLTHAARAPAKEKELPHLAETDPQATALGYKHHAAKVDLTKYGNYKPGQDCEGCAQFDGKKGDAWAACKIFPGKAVNARGWCSAYQPKKA